MAGNLAGAQGKCGRAREHQETLLLKAGMLPGFSSPYFYRVFPKVHRDGLEYRFYVGEIPPFDAEDFALIAGDCLFNLRAALDHIVYELHARRYRGNIPADAEKDSAFPIITTDPRLKPGGRGIATAKWNEIRRLSIKQRRAIEFLQPYNGRNDHFRDVRLALAGIQRLNNIGKHRHLHVVRAVVIGSNAPWFPHKYGFRSETFYVPVESQTEVFRWTFEAVPPDANAQMHMNNEVAVNVCLDEAGSYTALAPLLETYINQVEVVLRRFDVFFP